MAVVDVAESKQEWMQMALDQAAAAIGMSDPNPRVGCVLVSPLGTLLAQGHTQVVGGPHAEAMALQACHASGATPIGATAYVTLEPCAHFGRTPPCADALIKAGVTRVVVALIDPNPLVAGQGVARMREAGIQVDVLLVDDPLAIQARELNIGFFTRMVSKRPWVRLKVATSLDGYTALASGISKWITSDAARMDGHIWRARSTAILTGIGTVMADDPALTVRGIKVVKQPMRVVVDSNLRLSPQARVLKPDAPVRIYTAQPDLKHQDQLEALGAKVISLAGAQGQVQLSAMLTDLATQQINELHVEAGAKLNGALLKEGLVDELLVYVAPKLLAQGRSMWEMPAPLALDQAQSWYWHSVEQVGPDLRLLLRRHRGAIGSPE